MIIRPKGTTARRFGPKKRHQRGEFIVPGPDWLWSIDGHDKFRNYGIEIYAAVDVYSRRIQWFYIGNSNRRGISILHQGLSTIRYYRRCPSFFRSDRGKEVLLLADAHFSLFIQKQAAAGATEEELQALRIRQCWMLGTSTANIKVESLWIRMITSQTAPWLVSIYLNLMGPVANDIHGETSNNFQKYFKFLEASGFYASDYLEDRIIFLFIFVPILRHELHSYIEVHNEHRIRPQLKRDHHIAGRPNDLYTDAEATRFGWIPDEALLTRLEEAVSGFG